MAKAASSTHRATVRKRLKPHRRRSTKKATRLMAKYYAPHEKRPSKTRFK